MKKVDLLVVALLVYLSGPCHVQGNYASSRFKIGGSQRFNVQERTFNLISCLS